MATLLSLELHTLSFHFSIGRINPVLYALGPGTWNRESHNERDCQQTDMEAWLSNYVDALCINSWQVIGILFETLVEIFLITISSNFSDNNGLVHFN